MSDYIETATIISPLQRLRIGGDGAVVANTSSSPKATIAPPPCLVYIDVSFVSGSNSAEAIADTAAAVLADPLRYDDVLTFRNYYTSSITILQLSSASSKYVPILENRKLMTNAYCEEGSQSWCVIHFTEFNSNFVRGRPIRIIMNQPGSMWKVFEIRAVKVLRRVIDPHSSHQLQHQLVRSGGSGKDFISKGGDRDVLSSVGDLKGSFCEMIQQDYRVFVDAVKEQTLSKDFYSTASSSAAAIAGTSAESSQRTGNSSKAGNNTLKKKDSSKETTKKKVN